MLNCLARRGDNRGRKPLVTGLTTLLTAAALAHPAAGAAEDEPSMFALRGFGTLGVVHSSLDDADFVSNTFQQDGAGLTRSWAASVDSKLGLQLDANFNRKLSAVLQLVAQYDDDGQYTPEVEWAYLDYQFTPDFTVRLGRIVIATFMESETRMVGYTYPWVRPPQEVYGSNPVTNKDGIDILYRFPTGLVTNTLQLSYGDTRQKFIDNGELDVSHTTNLQYIAEYGPTRFRLGYNAMHLDISSTLLDTLFDGLEQFGAAVPGPAGRQASLNAEHFRSTDTRYEIFSAGIAHDSERWLLRAEWARADLHRPTFISDSDAWYITAGYRLGAFTPYLTAARLHADRLAAPAIPTGDLPPQLAPFAEALNDGLDELVDSGAAAQKRVAAGLRWDLGVQAALKLQFEHLRTEGGSSGRLFNASEDFEPGDSTNVVSIAVDFVF